MSVEVLKVTPITKLIVFETKKSLTTDIEIPLKINFTSRSHEDWILNEIVTLTPHTKEITVEISEFLNQNICIPMLFKAPEIQKYMFLKITQEGFYITDQRHEV